MSARPPDYYAILHVDPAAPAEVIRASYRALMQQLRAHPDLGGDHDAATLLNAAYAVLKNPARRAQYDTARARGGGESGPRAAGAAAPSRAPRPATRAATTEQGQRGSTGAWATEAGTGPCADICPFCGVDASRGRHGSDYGDDCRVCAAPLAMVQSVGQDSDEPQRSVYRIARAEALRVYVDPQDRTGFDALVHDISLSGMRLSCAHELAQGALIRVDCAICAAVARIAHVSRTGSDAIQYGAEFLTVRFKRQRGSLLSVPA